MKIKNAPASRGASDGYRMLGGGSPRSGQLLLAGVAVFSLEGLDHEPLFDGSGGDLDPLRSPIHDRPYILEIGLECPLVDRGDLQANAT